MFSRFQYCKRITLFWQAFDRITYSSADLSIVRPPYTDAPRKLILFLLQPRHVLIFSRPSNYCPKNPPWHTYGASFRDFLSRSTGCKILSHSKLSASFGSIQLYKIHRWMRFCVRAFVYVCLNCRQERRYIACKRLQARLCFTQRHPLLISGRKWAYKTKHSWKTM